jgi:biopolymer transport protein ExbD
MRAASPGKADLEEIAEINVVPLGDVSLVLLIALMMIMPMVMQSMIKVVASRAVAAPAERMAEKPLFVEVNPSGILLNNVPMKSDEDFFLRLRGEVSRKNDKSVLIAPQGDVAHGRVVEVLDISKLAGVEKLSLVKHRENTGGVR